MTHAGAVITVAGAQASNAAGLVYVSAYALAEGESVLDINSRFPARRLGPALRPVAFSTGTGQPAIELYLRREEFRDVIAADLPAQITTVLACSQRPITAAALEERGHVAAWRTLPSWYAVATAGRVIEPEGQRFMAQRAGSRTVDVEGSHAVALSQPRAVAGLIRTAVTTLAGRSR